VRGAQLVAEGRSIIALPATAREGTISRIVPQASNHPNQHFRSSKKRCGLWSWCLSASLRKSLLNLGQAATLSAKRGASDRHANRTGKDPRMGRFKDCLWIGASLGLVSIHEVAGDRGRHSRRHGCRYPHGEFTATGAAVGKRSPISGFQRSARCRSTPSRDHTDTSAHVTSNSPKRA
jgi:hypothetical protein